MVFYTEVMTSAHDDDAAASSATVLSLMKYIPYPGIPHAGGAYADAHVSALKRFAKVTVLAPETPQNRVALKHLDSRAGFGLLTQARPRLRGIVFRLAQLESVLAGSAIYWPVRKLFRSEKAPWSAIAQAEAVEFQWSEMIALAPSVRERYPKKLLIGVAHDIVTQRWQRFAQTRSSILIRWLALLASKLSARQEARSFAALDCLLVFSEKDADLAKQLEPDVQVEVVHPGLGPSEHIVRSRSTDEPVVLFVGAMSRPENCDAVLWFVERIWGDVLKEVPRARFVVAGANPTPELERAIQKTPRTELTGFVESLEPWYSRASVCVVPVQTGAGVKFKTLDALIRGVPTVSTSVGAEGIEGPDVFAAVSDDAAEFARATIGTLRAPDEDKTERAQKWAESEYGKSTFNARLKEVYGRFLSAQAS